jgi:peptidoglycan/LPS O-acetylase OafA/YrhL
MLLELYGLVGILGTLALAAWLGGRERTPEIAAREFATRRYFSGLDGLRAISVVAVIWCHVAGPQQLNLLNQGNKGVDLFFAISGFLVTTLLLREYRERGSISLTQFYIRRSLRIFPLYYAVLFLYCVLVLATMRGTVKAAEFWDNLPAFLTYTSNWFVDLNGAGSHGTTFYFAWSLATEEQFYLFWPALLLLSLWLTKRSWAPAVAAVLLICIQLIAVSHVKPTLMVIILASLAPAILFGVVFAVLLHNRRIFDLLYPVIGNRLMAPAAAGLLLACLQFDADLLLIRFLMALLVASVCVRDDTVLHPVLNWRPAVFMGAISYGMYLMHMLAANFARILLGHLSGLDVFVVTLLVVTVMAFLSYRIFEAPILKLKGRFQPGKTVEPVVGPAAPTV